ncbi:MAG: SusC/RagA family TonB-linked outer membrane protein [candidate division KSB1 bacterium]|nr:SusC/RagA family TonB-linked outer membrane protein [candidate division KSB1 bacterium]MDZ7367957.1 SusC/RagA family TonB-linked outer membrane protein [candidate division KSB1 bacterium]MDZ7405580.1 SusC/RagA family TonB-linked outer membrane protein [candidate division KSB1 bacterium]
MMGKTLRFLAGIALFPVLVLAQDATITGKVTDAAGNPLPGANVILELTNLGAATDANGNYHFTVPAKAVKGQKVRLTARFVGYRSRSEDFNLQAGAISKDFALPQDVLDLDAIIVTGVLEETPKTKMAFSVSHVSDEALKQVPASSPEAALYGKVPGVRIVRGTGQPGTAASIQLRAPTSINTSGRSADPLYIVDGVVIDPSVSGSPLTDIPADDIENIEVVKGASGASVYGSRAANGVVRITTKRGNKLGLDQTKITVRNEFGKSSLENKIKLNQHHNYKIATTSYTDSRGVAVTPGDFVDANGNWLDPRLPTRAEDLFATGISFYDKPYKYVSTGAAKDAAGRLISPRDANGNIIPPTLLSAPFDHMERFFDPGTFMSNTISVSRNMENTNFSVSFGNRTEGGVITGIDGLNRKNVRVALDHKIRRSLSVGLSGLYTITNRDLISSSYDGLFSLTFMAPDANLELINPATGRLYIQPDPTSVEENPLYYTRYNDRDDQRKRILGSFNLRYDPVDWFNVEGNLSFDRSDRNNEMFWPIGYEAIPNATEYTGRYIKGNFADQALNGGMTASFSRRFGALILRAKAQGVFERTEYDATSADGAKLAVQGVRNLGATGQDTRSTGSQFEQVRSSGYSGILSFDYKDRYIGDVHVRRDGSSLFGEDDRWHTYYRASAAYRISQENFWFLPFFEEFKLRGSYGTAGGRPNFFARYETWSVGGGAVTKLNLGNKLLRPEFAKELELGVDTAFLNRFTLDVTYARSNVDDQILFVPLPGYAGYRNQWQNAGTLKTNTIEASLNAAILRSRSFDWKVGVNFDRTRQKIAKLNIPEYRTGPFQIRQGESIGAMFGDRWIRSLDELPPGLPRDQFNVNDDGYVVWVGAGKTFRDGIAQKLWGTSTTLTDERKVNHTFRWGIPIKFSEPVFDRQGNFLRYSNYVKIGETQPDFNLGFHSDFRWKNVHVYTVLDAQIGGDIYNQTVQWGLRENKLGIVDQAGKPDELKKPGLYYQVLYNVNATNSHFVEDGTYLKLRELAVTYTFQQKALSRVFGGLMERLSIGVVGRNLLTFTDYTGYDPETGSNAFSIGNAAVARIDDFGYPNFRTLTGIIEFDF